METSLLPADASPPAAMKAFPAGMLMSELPGILNEVPVEMLYYFAENFGLELEVAAFDPSLSAVARYMEDGTLSIPETYNTCIVLAYEMDYAGYKTSPGYNSGAATGNGYSRMAFTASCLAEFIRNLGYGAVPCGNNTALSVPLAIDAGLGEKSRMGCVVTPKYGPRVRLNKIFTNLPLDHDAPISFGVEEFCQVCKKCIDSCPSSALRDTEQSFTNDNISSIKGVKKWQHDMEKCLKFWMENGNDCAMCFTVCPFNKPEGWLHEATRILIGAQSGALDKLLVNLDSASGFGKIPTDEETLAFWDTDTYVHIKD